MTLSPFLVLLQRKIELIVVPWEYVNGSSSLTTSHVLCSSAINIETAAKFAIARPDYWAVEKRFLKVIIGHIPNLATYVYIKQAKKKSQ